MIHLFVSLNELQVNLIKIHLVVLKILSFSCLSYFSNSGYSPLVKKFQ